MVNLTIYGSPFLRFSRVIRPHIAISALHPYKHYNSYSYCTNNVSTKPLTSSTHNLDAKNSADERLARVRLTVLFADTLGLSPQKYDLKKFADLRNRCYQAGSCDHVTNWVGYSGTKFVLNEPYHVSPNYHQRLANDRLVARELPTALSPYCGLWDPNPGATPGTKSFLISDIANSCELNLIVKTAEAIAENLPDWNSLAGIVYV